MGVVIRSMGHITSSPHQNIVTVRHFTTIVLHSPGSAQWAVATPQHFLDQSRVVSGQHHLHCGPVKYGLYLVTVLFKLTSTQYLISIYAISTVSTQYLHNIYTGGECPWPRRGGRCVGVIMAAVAGEQRLSRDLTADPHTRDTDT